jgi:peptide/nickel transport system substrate-binding protein
MFGLKKGASGATPRRRRRLTAVAVVGVLGSGMLAACGGGGGASAASDTLTVALPSFTPQNFDLPTNCSSPVFELAYEPLIRINSKGEYESGIAESWKYSNNNKVFTMKIRSGIKFADGTDVTVKSVVDTLKYDKSVPGLNDGYLKPVTVEAVGTDSVRLTSKQPARTMESLLSSGGSCNNGMIISEAGLKDPSKMKTAMFGAGPYVYVADESEPGDHYTYTPNPKYYDKSRQHWKKIVLRVIGDANTAFDALATGQVQVNTVGGETLLDKVKSKGFDVTEGRPWGFGIMLWDREGKIAKALADVRVRQAMAYALDREQIAKVVGPATEPLDQFGLPGLTGHDPAQPTRYSYDVDKAKKLLAEAGYPDGFTATMLVDSDDPDAKNGVSATVEQLSKVGIRIELKSSPETTFFTDLASAKYPMGAMSWALLGDIPTDANRLYKLPFSAVLNPMGSADPELDKAYDKLATSDDATVEEQAKHFNEVMTEKAWYVPISASPRYVYSKGVEIGKPAPDGEYDVTSWQPKG